MNERLKQLAIEAKLIAPEYNGFDHTRLSISQQRFAELIVRECAKVAVNKDSGYIHPADVAGYMAAGRSTAAQMIREHFGVEE